MSNICGYILLVISILWMFAAFDWAWIGQRCYYDSTGYVYTCAERTEIKYIKWADYDGTILSYVEYTNKREKSYPRWPSSGVYIGREAFMGIAWLLFSLNFVSGVILIAGYKIQRTYVYCIYRILGVSYFSDFPSPTACHSNPFPKIRKKNFS